MKKSILLLTVAVAMLTSCISVQEIKSDKPIKVEKRQTGPFERVRLIGSPTVYYAQGNTTSVRVEAPEDLLEYVVTEVKDSSLNIRLNDQAKSIIKNFRFIQGDDLTKNGEGFIKSSKDDDYISSITEMEKNKEKK